MVKEIRLELINSITHLITRRIKFKKKEIIFEQNSSRNNTYVLLKGKIKLSFLLPNGNEINLGFYNAKNVILASTDNRYPFMSLFKVEAVEDCLLGVVPVESIENNEYLYKIITRYYDIIFKKVYLQMIDLLSKNKLESLYCIFIRLANTYGIKVYNGIKINIKLSNIDLAGYIGTSKETVSRLMSEMKNLDLIVIENKYIVLKDINYMKKKVNYYNNLEELYIV